MYSGTYEPTGRKIGYLRVSTSEQRPDRQVEGLKEICDELHIEVLSAVKDVRPVFDAVLARLETGDMLVVWDLDRAFRSTIDALVNAEKLRERGIDFRVATMSIDTSTEFGELFYTIAAAFAQFERRNLARRTREGLAAARARGMRLGRPRKLSDLQVALVRWELEETDVTIKDLAARYGVAPWSLTRSLRRKAETDTETGR